RPIPSGRPCWSDWSSYNHFNYSSYRWRVTRFVFRCSAPSYFNTLSLHDALPISSFASARAAIRAPVCTAIPRTESPASSTSPVRSEEHTSELQSQSNLVCRLLLEKKNYHSRFLLDGHLRPSPSFICPSFPCS